MIYLLTTLLSVAILIAIYYAVKFNKIKKLLQMFGKSIKVKKPSGIPSAKEIRMLTNARKIRK